LEGSAPACSRRRTRARCLVVGALLATALAVAPAVRADPGDPGPAQESTAGADAAPAQGAEANAAPGNSGDAPGQLGDPGNSGNAPGHQDDVTQTAEDDQGASVGQSADASASAGQEEVDNTAASVRVDEPGPGTAVGQENRASADAGASTDVAVDTPGETTVAQSAESDAVASQKDVSNTSIVVRVGSPGNDPGVSQANIAVGSATATTSADEHASAAAEASQEAVTNTSVSVRVFSAGDDGPVTQLNAASASADASPGGSESAVVRQDGVQNTTVSIRVESPGSTAAPSQQNQGTALTSVAAVAVGGDTRNTVLTVALGGGSLARPGASGLQVWVWTWVWQRDETQDLAALSGLEPDSWSWSWDGANGGPRAPGGSVTTRAADEDDAVNAGSLEWSWSWTRAGAPGWAWDWNRRLGLSCGSCIWIWNWSWSWTGPPSVDDVAPPPVGSVSPGPVQLNAVAAQAEANASAGLVQTVVQSGVGEGTQFAGQLAAVSQDARAVATAQQTNVSSLLLGDSSAQSNLVVSAADAGVAGRAAQELTQFLDAAGTARGDQWGGQQLELSQLAGAAASASQRDAVLLGGGSHVARSSAAAVGNAAVEQRLSQHGRASRGVFSQWAGQLALVEQAAGSSSTVGQAGSAVSRARNLALVAQQADQWAARTGGLGSQSATQLAYTGQEAWASAVTVQQVGRAALPEASSDADARTRAKILQDASQRAGGSLILVQDLQQEAIVFQVAIALSTSHGGIAGRATVVDCAIVEQGATQAAGVNLVSTSSTGDLAFCLPPAASSTSPPVVLGHPTATGGGQPIVAAAPTSSDEANTAVSSATLVERKTSTQRRPEIARHARGSGSVPATLVRPRLVPGHTQLSVPPFTQARIDTRPGSHAGAGDAGKEPPLPPAGDPWNRVSALAAAASGAGPSGIAAISDAFALGAPVLVRAPQGSVVRRPADVLARIDVPV
jgi:hypothetical protein